MEQEVQTVLDKIVNKICKKSRNVTFCKNVRYCVIPNKEYISGMFNTEEIWWRPYDYAISREMVYRQYIHFMQTHGFKNDTSSRSIFWDNYM